VTEWPFYLEAFETGGSREIPAQCAVAALRRLGRHGHTSTLAALLSHVWSVWQGDTGRDGVSTPAIRLRQRSLIRQLCPGILVDHKLVVARDKQIEDGRAKQHHYRRAEESLDGR